jgi:hypothetical protein
MKREELGLMYGKSCMENSNGWSAVIMMITSVGYDLTYCTAMLEHTPSAKDVVLVSQMGRAEIYRS